ncbi:DUF2637 domain-containing protein [Streptomyces sp. NPDC006739]|uniref:DUF2637 domain-containing protein n=1 Tax=Streptomyces sp. NPDC006739 TaxID=3364763 RepID=UPI00369F45AB
MDNMVESPDATITPDSWDPAEELAEMLSAAAGGTPPELLLDEGAGPRHRVDRRRPRPGARYVTGRRRAFPAALLIVLITVCSVIMLGWSISYSYSQLRTVALLVEPSKPAQWWPLTVYGPWLVAGLSVLRASLQRRPARRSWAVMLLSSAMAVTLSVGHSPHSVLGMVVFGIPPITALACFRELVGQVSPPQGPRHAVSSTKDLDGA